MEKIKSYKDLVVWQKAHINSLEVIKLLVGQTFLSDAKYSQNTKGNVDDNPKS